jgi:hypothetical protein
MDILNDLQSNECQTTKGRDFLKSSSIMNISIGLQSNECQTTKGRDFLKSRSKMNISHLKTQINTHVTYGRMYYPQFKFRMDEIIKLNIEEWNINLFGSSHNDRNSTLTEKIEGAIDHLHWILDDEMYERIGKIRFENNIYDYPSITLTFRHHLICEIINDGKNLNLILFPMKIKSETSYKPINFYQYPINRKKITFELFKKILKDLGTDKFDISEKFDSHFYSVMKRHHVV